MYALNNELAKGHGVENMLQVCNLNHWDNSNTICIVEDDKNLDSQWWILEKEVDDE